MRSHPFLPGLVMCDDAHLAALVGEIAARKTLHEWQLSWVQRIDLVDGTRYIHKSQLPPTVEPAFYDAAQSPLLPGHRRLERFGECDTMLIEWLDAPRLDQILDQDERIGHAWRVLDLIAAMDVDLPVYLDLGSVGSWLAVCEDTFGKLRTLVSDGRFPSVSGHDVDRLRAWAESRAVRARLSEDPCLAHSDLRRDQIFVVDDGYRVIDWQRPVRGPAGIDTVRLLEDLGVDPRPHVNRSTYALALFLGLHWAIVGQHDLFPTPANALFDTWAVAAIAGILE